MTSIPSAQNTRPPSSSHKSRTFLLSGLFALLVTAVAVPLDLLPWVPAVGRLLERGGTVGLIAILAVALTLWIVIFCLIRLGFGMRDRDTVKLTRHRLTLAQYQNPTSEDLDRFSGGLTDSSPLAGRLKALSKSLKNDRDNAGADLASRSELDHARGDVSYLPARALVWALPALGFLGTAAEMSRAIGGLGTSVGATTGYGELRSALVSDVIPPLADAFGVTLFALGAAVICHLLLTWTNAADQRILLDVEEITMELVARIPAAKPEPASGSLNGELGLLTRELSQTRASISDSALQVASMDLGQLSHLKQLDELDLSPLARIQQLEQLVPMLQATNQRLDQIHAELRRDFVLARVSSPDEQLELRG